MMTDETVGASHDNDDRDPCVPRRCIYTPEDLERFRHSAAKRSLHGFATALGRACCATGRHEYDYDPGRPLVGLCPGLASLHGSLRAMAETWLSELPPDATARCRFGNPVFRAWHARLTTRSRAIVGCMLTQQRRHHGNDDDPEVSERCSAAGHRAACADADDAVDPDTRDLVTELVHYLRGSFGNAVRLDYGTGHESSFLVLLYAALRAMDVRPGPDTDLAPVALSLFAQYLRVTRGLQTRYRLEPAGSHGVWGLDDYHCLPFYFGACQLMTTTHHHGDDDTITPASIHDKRLLADLADSKLYFGCIKYVTELKRGVPFFESSPMLNDVSHLPSWDKVARGLLRLYEGEVLDKLPVVQHFLFGKTLFQADWTPSRTSPKPAPTRTFLRPPGGMNEVTVAPWTKSTTTRRPPPMNETRAPWAK